jgi:hypothetical protein
MHTRSIWLSLGWRTFLSADEFSAARNLGTPCGLSTRGSDPTNCSYDDRSSVPSSETLVRLAFDRSILGFMHDKLTGVGFLENPVVGNSVVDQAESPGVSNHCGTRLQRYGGIVRKGKARVKRGRHGRKGLSVAESRATIEKVAIGLRE